MYLAHFGPCVRLRRAKWADQAGFPSAMYPLPRWTLTVNPGGIEREVTIDEALEAQTYLAAVKGNKTAIRTILKMIEKR